MCKLTFSPHELQFCTNLMFLNFNALHLLVLLILSYFIWGLLYFLIHINILPSPSNSYVFLSLLRIVDISILITNFFVVDLSLFFAYILAFHF